MSTNPQATYGDTSSSNNVGASAQQQQQQQQQQQPPSDRDPVDRMEVRMRGLLSDFKQQLSQVKGNYQKTGSLMPSSSQQQPGGYGSTKPGAAGIEQHGSTVWGPQVDVLETEQDFLIVADLPGVKRDDLVVEVHDRNLFLSGETRQQQVYMQQGTMARVTERRYGKFSRTIVLAKPVDQDNVNARFEDGVLEVKLPKLKHQQAAGVRIPIQGITGQGTPQGGQQGQQGHQQPYSLQQQDQPQQGGHPQQGQGQQGGYPQQGQGQQGGYSQQPYSAHETYPAQQQQGAPGATQAGNPPSYAVGDVKQ